MNRDPKQDYKEIRDLTSNACNQHQSNTLQHTATRCSKEPSRVACETKKHQSTRNINQNTQILHFYAKNKYLIPSISVRRNIYSYESKRNIDWNIHIINSRAKKKHSHMHPYISARRKIYTNPCFEILDLLVWKWYPHPKFQCNQQYKSSHSCSQRGGGKTRILNVNVASRQAPLQTRIGKAWARLRLGKKIIKKICSHPFCESSRQTPLHTRFE